MHALVADDDPIAARALRSLVEAAGHTVDSAEDGLRAWELFAERRHALVITDWMMPRLDGTGLCRRIREHDAAHGSYAYVLLVTARSERADRLEALDAGVDDFLSKPLDAVDFKARLRAGERILSYQRSLADANAQLREHQASQRRQAAMLDAALSHSVALVTALREQQAAILVATDVAARADAAA